MKIVLNTCDVDSTLVIIHALSNLLSNILILRSHDNKNIGSRSFTILETTP